MLRCRLFCHGWYTVGPVLEYGWQKCVTCGRTRPRRADRIARDETRNPPWMSIRGYLR